MRSGAAKRLGTVVPGMEVANRVRNVRRPDDGSSFGFLACKSNLVEHFEQLVRVLHDPGSRCHRSSVVDSVFDLIVPGDASPAAYQHYSLSHPFVFLTHVLNEVGGGGRDPRRRRQHR